MRMAAEQSRDSSSSTTPDVANLQLLVAIKETQSAVELVLNNRFEDAQKSLEAERASSIYHALGHATILYIRAGMTFDRVAFDEALTAISEALQVVKSKRRGWSFFRSATSQSTIDSLTNEQLHAELCHAELLLEQSMLTVMLNESGIFRMVGALLGVKDAFSTYKYCSTILEKRVWKSGNDSSPEKTQQEAAKVGETQQEVLTAAEVEDLLRQHFESGVRLGLGAFNVLLSSLPDVAMRMLALVGISGQRKFGFEQMKIASEMRNGETIRGILSTIALLAFHLIVAYSFGTADGDLGWCEIGLQRVLARYPNCAIFLYFSGRLKLVQGRVTEASETLQKAIDVQGEWRELHYACRWEMMWCAAYQGDWMEAYSHADALLQGCGWSKALFAYCAATFLYHHRIASAGETATKTDLETDDRLEKLFASVHPSMQRIAGKHLPMEKLAEKRARQFKARAKLNLPAFELIYIFCGVPMLANNATLLANFLYTIDESLNERHLPVTHNASQQLRLQKSDRCSLDEACLLYLLKAACLANGDCTADSLAISETLLKTILSHEESAKTHESDYEAYLYPCAKVELALLRIRHSDAAESDLLEAVQLLESAESDHPKYFLRSRVHVRIRSLLNNLTPQLEQSATKTAARRSSAQASPSSSKVEQSTSRLQTSASVTFVASRK